MAEAAELLGLIAGLGVLQTALLAGVFLRLGSIKATVTAHGSRLDTIERKLERERGHGLVF